MRGKMNFLLLLLVVFIPSVTSTDFQVAIDGQGLHDAFTSTPGQVDGPPDTMTAFGIPYDKWRCGAGEYITKMVIIAINQTCPAAAVDFNHCCAVHDDCYGNQRGRQHCDKQFCGCLKFYAENTDATKCSPLSNQACGLIQNFGGSAYAAAAEVETTTNSDPYLPKDSKRIETEYKKVYEKCTTQQVTLESCALNYDICTRGHDMFVIPSEVCTLNLLRCLDDTRNDRNPNKECDVAVEELLLKMVYKEEPIQQVVTEGSGDVEGSGGDLNVLMLQGIQKNQTFVKKIYLQIVKTTTSFSWIVYFCFFFSILLCCIISVVGISRNSEDERRRRGHQDEVINVHISSTSSGMEPRNKKTTSESEAPSSSISKT